MWVKISDFEAKNSTAKYQILSRGKLLPGNKIQGSISGRFGIGGKFSSSHPNTETGLFSSKKVEV